MQRLRMVPLTTVTNGFHARVIAARLGSEGIVTQLRGGVDGPYPMGDVEVLVSAEDLEAARDLLLADEVEAALDDPDDHSGGEGNGSPRPALSWLLVVAVLVVVSFALARVLGRA